MLSAQILSSYHPANPLPRFARNDKILSAQILSSYHPANPLPRFARNDKMLSAQILSSYHPTNPIQDNLSYFNRTLIAFLCPSNPSNAARTSTVGPKFSIPVLFICWNVIFFTKESTETPEYALAYELVGNV